MEVNPKLLNKKVTNSKSLEKIFEKGKIKDDYPKRKKNN